MPVNLKLQAQQRALLTAAKTTGKLPLQASEALMTGSASGWSAADMAAARAGKTIVFYVMPAASVTRYGSSGVNAVMRPYPDLGNVVYNLFKGKGYPNPPLDAFNKARLAYIDAFNRQGHLADNMVGLMVAASILTIYFAPAQAGAGSSNASTLANTGGGTTTNTLTSQSIDTGLTTTTTTTSSLTTQLKNIVQDIKQVQSTVQELSAAGAALGLTGSKSAPTSQKAPAPVVSPSNTPITSNPTLNTLMMAIAAYFLL